MVGMEGSGVEMAETWEILCPGKNLPKTGRPDFYLMGSWILGVFMEILWFTRFTWFTGFTGPIGPMGPMGPPWGPMGPPWGPRGAQGGTKN